MGAGTIMQSLAESQTQTRPVSNWCAAGDWDYCLDQETNEKVAQEQNSINVAPSRCSSFPAVKFLKSYQNYLKT